MRQRLYSMGKEASKTKEQGRKGILKEKEQQAEMEQGFEEMTWKEEKDSPTG